MCKKTLRGGADVKKNMRNKVIRRDGTIKRAHKNINSSLFCTLNATFFYSLADESCKEKKNYGKLAKKVIINLQKSGEIFFSKNFFLYQSVFRFQRLELILNSKLDFFSPLFTESIKIYLAFISYRDDRPWKMRETANKTAFS